MEGVGEGVAGVSVSFCGLVRMCVAGGAGFGVEELDPSELP